MKSIKVLLADDQRLFVDGLVAVLEQAKEIEIVGQVYDGEQVLEFLEKQEVDIIVLDVEMPNLNGVDAAAIITQKYPKIKILILSMYNDKRFIVNLMRLGVAGYILKNKSKEELVSAIYNVHRGNAHFGLEVLNSIAKTDNRPAKEDVELSDRQKEILIKIAEGNTTKQIADLLHISETTVNTHRRNLLRKLGVPNEKFLVRYAIRKGLIDP
ncbi:MAG: response regulator transcription factor [Bacteroidota bacterium]